MNQAQKVDVLQAVRLYFLEGDEEKLFNRLEEIFQVRKTAVIA